jgi:hypothetical protein
MVVIGVDIDGTIAKGNWPRFKDECNQRFQLGILGERLDSMGYRAFMESPEITKYKDRVGAVIFEEEIERIENDPEMYRTLPTIPQAVESLNKLSQVGRVCYYTVRKSDNPALMTEKRKATREWLQFSGFPNSERVFFCRSAAMKLVRLYENERDNKEPLILIDDSYRWIIRDAVILKENCPDFEALCDRFTLIAYGGETDEALAITNGLTVVSLHSWEHSDDIYSCIGGKKEHDIS